MYPSNEFPTSKRERELSEDETAQSDIDADEQRTPPAKRSRHNIDYRDDDTVVTIHQVYCGRGRGRQADHTSHAPNVLYLDHPRLFYGDDKASQLRGTKRLSDDSELAASAGIVIYQSYACDAYLRHFDTFFEPIELPHLQETFLRANQARFFRFKREGPAALPQSIRLDLQSTQLVSEISAILSHSDILSGWQEERSLSFPFPFFFHHAAEVQAAVDLSGGPGLQKYVALLLHCIADLGRQDHAEAEQLFSRGLVDRAHFSKLFRAGELVVTRKDRVLVAHRLDRIREAQDGISLECWSYDFNGSFKMRQTTLYVRRPSEKEAISINSLEAFPLRLDLSGIRQDLLSRGCKFWECRARKYIHYTAPRMPFESQTVSPKVARHGTELTIHRHNLDT